jgi:hypothetical protein
MRVSLAQFHRQVPTIGGMQSALQLLCQYHLTHLQVRVLQVEKDLAFLQCPAKAKKLFEPGAGRAHLDKEVLLDSISTDMTSVAFCAHLPKHVHKGRQSFLPRDHDTLSAIQLPLPSKELPLQLNDHRM